MRKFFKKKYRIRTAAFAGYDVQVRRSWWPFWRTLYSEYIYRTVEDAQKRIETEERQDAFKPKVVWP